MDDDIKQLAVELSEGGVRLTERERRLVKKIVRRISIARNANDAFAQSQSFGDRMADRVAAVGGSWGFVGGFALFLAVWAAINLFLPADGRFDPYPFIFLNLLLSMLAAVQAPIIMMSQNRQAAKDRLAAQLDYEVNLKAETEVSQIVEKLDRLTALVEGKAKV